MDLIASTCFADGVQRLMNVADEVHQKLQSFDSLIVRSVSIGKHSLENLNPVHHAIVVILFAQQMTRIRTIAVAGLGEISGTHRDIYKVPGRGFRAVRLDSVGPVRDGCEIIVAE